MKKIILILATGCTIISCNNGSQQAAALQQKITLDSMNNVMARQKTIDSMNAVAAQSQAQPAQATKETTVTTSEHHYREHNYSNAGNGGNNNNGTNNTNGSNYSNPAPAPAPVAAAPEQKCYISCGDVSLITTCIHLKNKAIAVKTVSFTELQFMQKFGSWLVLSF